MQQNCVHIQSGDVEESWTVDLVTVVSPHECLGSFPLNSHFLQWKADEVLASQVCRKGRGKVAKSFGLLPLLLPFFCIDSIQNS